MQDTAGPFTSAAEIDGFRIRGFVISAGSDRRGEKFMDTLAVCVDLLSSWIVAVLLSSEGLTSEVVAKGMYKQWQMFGISSTVKLDGARIFGG